MFLTEHLIVLNVNFPFSKFRDGSEYNTCIVRLNLAYTFIPVSMIILNVLLFLHENEH